MHCGQYILLVFKHDDQCVPLWFHYFLYFGHSSHHSFWSFLFILFQDRLICFTFDLAWCICMHTTMTVIQCRRKQVVFTVSLHFATVLTDLYFLVKFGIDIWKYLRSRISSAIKTSRMVAGSYRNKNSWHIVNNDIAFIKYTANLVGVFFFSASFIRIWSMWEKSWCNFSFVGFDINIALEEAEPCAKHSTFRKATQQLFRQIYYSWT